MALSSLPLGAADPGQGHSPPSRPLEATGYDHVQAPEGASVPKP
jgi:hypothetical protein